MIGWMWSALASAQVVVTNPGLNATPPDAVPNEGLQYVVGWSYGTPDVFADIAAQKLELHCQDFDWEPSPNGGTFAHATAIPGQSSPSILSVVGGLVPGRAYKVQFQAAAVQLLGRSGGFWRVRFGEVSLDAAPLLLASVSDPGQTEWQLQHVHGFIAPGPDAELEFTAISLEDGTTDATTLPQEGCDYPSDRTAATTTSMQTAMGFSTSTRARRSRLRLLIGERTRVGWRCLAALGPSPPTALTGPPSAALEPLHRPVPQGAQPLGAPCRLCRSAAHVL